MLKLSCSRRRRRWNQGVLTGLAENRVAFVARGDVAAAAAGILIGAPEI